MTALGLIQLGVLAAALFAGMVAAGVAAAYPHLRPRLAALTPARRARRVLALSVLPAIAAVGLTALCFLPSALDMLWPGLDHCPHHGDGHPHLCLVHRPLGPGSALGWAVAIALAAGVTAAILRRLGRLVRSRRALRQLARTAAFHPRQGVSVVESEVPFAVTTGLLRCRTLASTALLGALPPEQVAAVIEHEKAHARRRDTLVKLVAALLSLLHLPRTRRALLADLDLAAEQACDEAAGERLGDRLRVAQALLALERLLQGAPARFGLAGVSFGGSSLVPRVESLLAEPTAAPAPSRLRCRVTVAAAGMLLLLLTGPLHHLTETILGLIAR